MADVGPRRHAGPGVVGPQAGARARRLVPGLLYEASAGSEVSGNEVLGRMALQHRY